MSEKGKINEYVCDKCFYRTITINEVDGTTAFMIRCRRPEGCDGMADSQFCRVPQDAPATHGWYKPDDAELARASDEVREYVAKGCLLLREIKSVPSKTPSRRRRTRWYLPPPKPPYELISRNAACPCGSGKKFKRCCKRNFA